MKLQKCLESYEYNSAKASDISRNLCFAGLALVWAFRITRGDTTDIPPILRYAGVLLLIGLALDFLQYITGTVIWGSYHRYKEKKVSNSDEFLAPKQINWPVNTLFVLKHAATFISYIFLVISMFDSFWK
jgi:hypothetical protein